MAARMAKTFIALVVAATTAAAVAEEETWVCEDYTNATNPGCYNNITWALETGIVENATWYPEFANTRADFQCALFMKFGNPSDPWTASHGCVLPPCTPPSPTMTSKWQPTIRSVKNNCYAPEPEESSMPWWGYLLIVLGVLGAIGAVVAVVMQKPKPKKKKRALKPAPVPVKTEPLPTYKMVVTAPPGVYR